MFTAISLRLLRRLFAACLAMLCFTTSAQAHVRWFVEENPLCSLCHFEWDLTSWLVIAGAVAFAGLAVAIHRTHWLQRLRARCWNLYLLPEGTEWRLVGFLAGLMLVGNTTMRVFLAPHLQLPGNALGMIGLTGQFLLGLLLLSQFSFSIAGLLTVAVSLLSALVVPPIEFANYFFEFAGLGLALFFVGPALSPVDRRIFRRWGLDGMRFEHLPLPIIRIAVGITLVVLALDEKLLHPHLSVLFLQQHQFNFMPLLGFEGFTNLHFTLAAGVAELTFGVLLAVGIATRFVTTCLSTFFVATLLVLGPIELLGHAPLFGIAFLLISQGSGSYALLSEASSGRDVETVSTFRDTPPEILSTLDLGQE